MPDIGCIVKEGEVRWYLINGVWRISVTSFLSVLGKPGLIWWAANEERKLVADTLLQVLTRERAHEPEFVLDEFIKMLDSQKAHVRAKKAAAEIGTQAHQWIEWRTRHLLGQEDTPEPIISVAAMTATYAWEEWAREVDFTPLLVEHTVWHERYDYAGTLDTLAKVKGVVTLVDYVTAKAVYPEKKIQVNAYRHAAWARGIDTQAGLIVRLPKREDDPVFEPVDVPLIASVDILSVLETWRLMRRLTGKPEDRPVKAAA